MRETIPTPYYLIDESALLRNLRVIDQVREQAGVKVLLALKCFATWSVFDLMREHMDGTTSSSLHPGRAVIISKNNHLFTISSDHLPWEDKHWLS